MVVTYWNNSGDQIVLNQTKPFFISSIDGAGQVRQTINTFHAPDQDGQFYISSTVDMRNITLEGSIVANSADDTFAYRRQLLKAFTPKQHGWLFYRNRKIPCIVEEAGFAVSDVSRAPAFFISLLCPSPFFEAVDESWAELALWRDNFSFPFEITPPGIGFGIREPSQIIDVDNIGDVPCGCRIAFSALGTIVNPELLLIDTGEYVRINTTMQNGDTIYVDTHFANKRVTKVVGSVQSNAFSLLDIGSSFFQLAAGINTLRYDAGQNLDLLEVRVFYSPQFLGV